MDIPANDKATRVSIGHEILAQLAQFAKDTDAGSVTVEITDEFSPVRLETDKGRGVLMPMRK